MQAHLVIPAESSKNRQPFAEWSAGPSERCDHTPVGADQEGKGPTHGIKQLRNLFIYQYLLCHTKARTFVVRIRAANHLPTGLFATLLSARRESHR